MVYYSWSTGLKGSIENEKTVLPSSNINDIVVEKDYIYGTRDGAVCKVTKDKYEIEELFNDNVKKYVKDGNMIFYTCANGGILKSYNEETKEITLDCIETTDEMVRTIIVVSATDTTLELDFNGEIRKFEKEE